MRPDDAPNGWNRIVITGLGLTSPNGELPGGVPDEPARRQVSGVEPYSIRSPRSDTVAGHVRLRRR